MWSLFELAEWCYENDHNLPCMQWAADEMDCIHAAIQTALEDAQMWRGICELNRGKGNRR